MIVAFIHPVTPDEEFRHAQETQNMSEGEIPPGAIAGAVVAAKALLRLEGAGEDALLGALGGSALCWPRRSRGSA